MSWQHFLWLLGYWCLQNEWVNACLIWIRSVREGRVLSIIYNLMYLFYRWDNWGLVREISWITGTWDLSGRARADMSPWMIAKALLRTEGILKASRANATIVFLRHLQSLSRHRYPTLWQVQSRGERRSRCDPCPQGVPGPWGICLHLPPPCRTHAEDFIITSLSSDAVHTRKRDIPSARYVRRGRTVDSFDLCLLNIIFL